MNNYLRVVQQFARLPGEHSLARWMEGDADPAIPALFLLRGRPDTERCVRRSAGGAVVHPSPSCLPNTDGGCGDGY